MQKYLFKNAQIATSSEVFTGSLLTDGETIGAVYREGETGAGGAPPAPPAPPADAEIIDATGMYLLPGGVDPHTHFDLDVGFTRASDDFYTGGIAAAFGGTTTVIDHMAFGPKGCALGHQAKVYHKLSRRCVIDYGFHGTIQHVDDTVLADMEALRDEEGISSMKLYLTYDDKIDDYGVLRVLQRAKQLGIVICAHCENDAIVTGLRRQFVQQGKTQPRYHPASRPAEAEAEAVFRFLALAKAAGDAKVYVVHLSTALGLNALRLARAFGQQNTYAETCPQYLFLDDRLYDDDSEGLKYIMSPPLRTTADMDVLWEGLEAGVVDTIGTDHCPFFFATQKQRGAEDFTQCPNGAPGVELRMPLLFSEGFMAGRLSLPQVVQTCCTKPAQVFGIAPKKGDITPGADADLVLYDPALRWRVTKDALHENVDYTPYEGITLTGKPILTMARGEVICRGGQFLGSEGRGRYLRRV